MSSESVEAERTQVVIKFAKPLLMLAWIDVNLMVDTEGQYKLTAQST